jgi:uncharacterized protein (TIGR02246 family)
MKHLFSLTLGLAAVTALALPLGADHPRLATSQLPAEEAIRAILTSQQTAWNQGDIPTFLKGYFDSPDLTFAGSDGIVRGYQGLAERYRKSYPDQARMGQLDFSQLEIRLLGPDFALVLGHWHLKRASGDVGGVFSLVWQRLPQGWRIIHDHTSAQK